MPARLFLLLLTAVLACGCPSPPPAVTRAVVVEIVAETLPLDRRWDGKIAANAPDVYVDIRQSNPSNPFNYNGSLVRSEIAHDATAAQLPLRLRPNPEATVVQVAAPVKLVVADRDGGVNSDDTLFETGTFRFASRLGGAAPGDTADLSFGDDETRVVLTVRWEAAPAR